VGSIKDKECKRGGPNLMDLLRRAYLELLMSIVSIKF
jgi:hypothetical protein